MKTMSGFMVFPGLDISAGSITAGSIRCQGEVLLDSQTKPLTEAGAGKLQKTRCFGGY